MLQSVFAIIKNRIVVNLTVGNFVDVSQAVSTIYGKDAIVVEVWSMYSPANVQIPVQINDYYKNGHFYRLIGDEEVEIPYIPNQDQRISSNEQAVEAVNRLSVGNSDSIDNLWVAILED